MYKHGVYVKEQPTAIKPAVSGTGCLPVVIGVAPVHLAKNPAKPNTPVLCYSYAEAVDAFGYSDNFEQYTISEAIYAMFALYGVGPVVFVNVLDVEKHKEHKSSVAAKVENHEFVINDEILYESLTIVDNSGSATLKVNVDYVLALQDDGSTKVSLLTGEHYNATDLTIEYDAVDPTKVTKADIIGGIDLQTGQNKGLECINSVVSKTGLVPGMIIAPKFSADAEVAAVMAAKADSINGVYTAVAFVDADTTTVRKYTDVVEWKNKNNITNNGQYVLWPKAKMGEKIYNLSTLAMGTQAKLVYNNSDIPYESPSNKNIQANGLCLADGTEVDMTIDQANYLNGQGIATAINNKGGWKLWGDETACYPSNTDPKDRFLSCRCMFNWDKAIFIDTYFNEIDKPLDPRHLEMIVDSENIRLNGLVSEGVLIAGSMEYRSDDNPVTSIISGVSHFHKVFVPPVPNRVIDTDIEFDAEAYKAALG